MLSATKFKLNWLGQFQSVKQGFSIDPGLSEDVFSWLELQSSKIYAHNRTIKCAYEDEGPSVILIPKDPFH